MNKFPKSVCLIFSLVFVLGGSACGGITESDSASSGGITPIEANCRIYPTRYEGIEKISDISNYA